MAEQQDARLDEYLELGAIGSTFCSVALTDTPWTLDVDCLVVSAGSGLGSLGSALVPLTPHASWRTIDYTALSPERPQLLPLGPASVPTTVQSAVIATPHGPDDQPTPAAAARATASAVRAASQAGSRAIGVPLLATGALGLSTADVAAAVIPAVIAVLGESSGRDLERLIFFARDDSTAGDIGRAWTRYGYGETPPRESVLPSSENAESPVEARQTGFGLRPAANELLTFAVAIAKARQSPQVTGPDILLASLAREARTRHSVSTLAQGATHALLAVLKGEPDPLVNAALQTYGVTEAQVSTTWPPDVSQSLSAAVRSAAEDLVRRLGGTEVYSHHLAAVALESPVPANVLATLEITQNELRRALRAGIADRWPQEAADVWNDVLAVRPYQSQGISSDFWTIQDSLGYSVYADAIARGIRHGKTRAPLTIGVKAPWGAGKTSLMRMVRDRLEWPDRYPDPSSNIETRPIALDQESLRLLTDETGGTKGSSRQNEPGSGSELNPVTNKTVLTAVKKYQSLAADRPRDEPDRTAALHAHPRAHTSAAPTNNLHENSDPRWRPTVWFNPWMYQSGEQVWAGLAYEIITQVTDRMDLVEREHFWLHLNRKRIDEQAVRRKIYGLVIDRMLPYLIGGLLALAVSLLLVAFAGWSALTGVLLAVAPGIVGAGGLIQRWRVQAAPASASFDHLVSTAADGRRAAADGLKGSYQQLVEAPDYRSKTGFFYLMHSDIERVLKLVTTDTRPLVIFVDDLDRCSPGTVVQVIEAINLFLAGQLSNCIFVLAMDPEVVATHIEIAYGTLAERLAKKSGNNDGKPDLGWRFLEKIIQLPLTLPAVEPQHRDTFYTSLFDIESNAESGSPSEAASSSQPSSREARPSREEVARAAEQLSDVSAATVGSLAASIVPGAAGREAARDVVDESLTAGTPEVNGAIALGTRHLNANPREIKRFVNIFRFLVMINNERGLNHLESVDSLDCLAKIAVLHMRWPALMGLLSEGGPTTAGEIIAVLERSEDDSSRVESTDGADSNTQRLNLARDLAQLGLSGGGAEDLCRPEFLEFVRAKPLVSAACRGLL